MEVIAVGDDAGVQVAAGEEPFNHRRVAGARVVHDPRHVGQMVGRHLGVGAETPGRGQHHAEVVVADPLPVHGVRPRQAGLAHLVDQGDVEFAAGAQPLNGLCRLGHGNPEVDAELLPCRVLPGSAAGRR